MMMMVVMIKKIMMIKIVMIIKMMIIKTPIKIVITMMKMINMKMIKTVIKIAIMMRMTVMTKRKMMMKMMVVSGRQPHPEVVPGVAGVSGVVDEAVPSIVSLRQRHAQLGVDVLHELSAVVHRLQPRGRGGIKSFQPFCFTRFFSRNKGKVK